MRIQVTGADRAKRMIDEAVARSRDLRPVLEVAGQDLRTLVDDSFKNSVSPGGTPWTPLAWGTIEARRGTSRFRGRTSGAPRQGPINARPLNDTLRLRNSITVSVAQRAVQLGTNVIYAATHLFGRGRIPARPFMPVGSEASRGPAIAVIQRISRSVAKYIADGTLT